MNRASFTLFAVTIGNNRRSFTFSPEFLIDKDTYQVARRACYAL